MRAPAGGAISLPTTGGLALGAWEALASLAGGTRNHLLDKLIRGRAWIALVAFALIGIVAMQLWVVKLNVGIGGALERTALLQQESSTLASEDSALSSGERIEQLAAAKGMVPAPPGALHFDRLQGPLDVRLAVAALARPIQPRASSAAGAEASASTATGAETSPSTTAGPETSASAGAGTETSASTSTGTETSASAATGSEAASTGAAAGTNAATGIPNATAEGAAGTPASTPTTSPTTASTSTPTSTGGSSEAASTPAGSGGGTQAPGG